MVKCRVRDFVCRYRNSKDGLFWVFKSVKLFNILDVLKRSGRFDVRIVEESDHLVCVKVVSSLVSKFEVYGSVYLKYVALLKDSKLKSRHGLYILSTSEHGLISSEEALRLKVGGKVLVYVE